MNDSRRLYLNPSTGEMRFDGPYPHCDDIPSSIEWPGEDQREKKPLGFKNLTLVLTQRCNLACDYCWQQHGAGKDMDQATIESWLDFFLDEDANSPQKVMYYGGEPLLRMDLIGHAARIISEVCDRRGIDRPSQQLFTNGTLLSRDRVDALASAGVFPIISVDGSPRVDRTHRHDAAGHSEHATIMDGMRRLRDRGVSFGVCCTLSDMCFDVAETVEYLLDEVRPASFELNIRHDRTFLDVAATYEGQRLNRLEEAWDVIASRGVRSVDLRKRVLPFVNRVPLQNSSSGSKNKLAVMPNGNVSPFNGAVARPELQVSPDGEWISEFRERWSRDVLTSERCKGCPAAFICGQGSAFSSYLQYGDFGHIPALHCEQSRTALSYIEKRIEEKLLSDGVPEQHVVTSGDVRRTFPALFDG